MSTQGPSTDLANLEFTESEMRSMGIETLERVIAHLASLPERPVCGDVRAEALCRAMREPPPEHGVPLESLLDDLFDEWIPRSFTTPAPGYLAYIPGGGLFPAALADLIADTTNRLTGIWHAAPALVQLEANVLDWFRTWMGFPPSTRGLLTTGGSMATFNAIVCARERLLGPEIRRGVLYTSTQAHHCVMKAARLAGVMPDRIRIIPADERCRLRVDLLHRQITNDREAGLSPFLVVSSAGTVNTGAVDPLMAIADICAREQIWHHVDGAYGGFFFACDHLRPLLRGLNRADSLTLDPHKGLFLPYGTGALLVRDGTALRDVHGGTAGYLPSIPDAAEFYDPSQHGPDLSRGFPGLRVWLCIKLLGAARFKAAIAEKRVVAVDAAEALARVPGIRLFAPPELSLFAFHLTWRGARVQDENKATELLLDRVRGRGRIMMTGCSVGHRFLARVCILSFRTRRQHVDTCVQHVTEEAEKIVRENGPRDAPLHARSES